MEEYSLYDNSGDRYVVSVKPAEARQLDVDNLKCYRLLKMLKEKGVAPLDNVSEVVASSPVTVGKTGGKWSRAACCALLRVCLPHQQHLRRHFVPVETWQAIATSLGEEGLTYNWQQVKEKIRNLKRQFVEVKSSGKTEGWTYFYRMAMIYDAPVGVVSPSSGAAGVTRVPDLDLDESMTPVCSSTIVASLDDDNAGGVYEHHESLLNDGTDFEGNNHNPVHQLNVPHPNICQRNQGAFGSRDMLVASPTEAGDLTMVRSPSKKRTKSDGPSFPVNLPRTPQKTPKRKNSTAKHLLNWPVHLTGAFISECVKRKEQVQMFRVPLKTWKDISEALELNENTSVAWTVCRDKFETMRDFFIGTMLPCQGEMANTKWPYFEQFCELFEIPDNYFKTVMRSDCAEVEDEDESDGPEGEIEERAAASSRNGKRKLWVDNIIHLFLCLYKQRKTSFTSTKSFLKHTFLYGQIAEEMADFGVTVSAKQCQDKMGRLKEQFGKEYEEQNKTGRAASKWVFFQNMMDIFEGSPTLDPPFTYSTGRGVRYQEKGVAKENREGNRTRPTASTEKTGGGQKGAKKSVYKGLNPTWQQVTQEAKVANQSLMVDELKNLRLTLQENQRERNRKWEMLLQKL